MKSHSYFYAASYLCIFLFLTATMQAEGVKVVSRMSYYTTEKQAEVLIYLPEGEATATVEGMTSPQTLKSGVNLLPIDLQSLATGDNLRNVKILNNGKEESFTVNLQRLQPKQNEVKIDRLTGGLLVDGLPWLPVGFYSSLKNHNFEFLKSEVTQGINLYSPYQGITDDNREARMAYLDLCAQLGIKVNYNICSLAGSQGVGITNKASEEAKMSALRNEILRVKDHPALLSYYIADEPDGQGVNPATLKKSYDLIHQLDPYHPVTIVIISTLPAQRFADTYDIVMADPYPIPNSPAIVASQMIGKIFQQMQYEKAVWLVPQVFGGSEVWKREPTAREVRMMVYGSIIEGARGIQGFHRMPDSGSPLLWNGFKEVAVELQQIAPYLYDANSKEVKCDQKSVMARSYIKGDNLLVVAQNSENSPCNITLTIPELAGKNGKAKLIFENRETEVNNGELKETLAAFGTGVYKIALKEQPSAVVPGNLIVNPSFEESVEAGEMTGGSGGVRNAGGNGATLLPDTRVAFDGETSLRLNNPQREAGALRDFYPIDNEADRTYIFSVMAKSDAASLAANKAKGEAMTFKLALGSLGEKTFELTDQWQRYEIVCPPKEYKRTHHGGASASITLIGEGTAWFDLAQITPEIAIQSTRTADRHGFTVKMECYMNGGEIRYTTNGKEPTAKSTLYTKPFEVRSVQTIRARVFAEGTAYNVMTQTVAAHKALDAKVKYLLPYSQQYTAGGDGAMTDGVFAPLNAQAPLWHGYLENDLDLIVDLGSVQPVKRVSMGFMQSLTAWVMPPKTVEIWTSKDGNDFQPAGKINYGEAHQGVGEYDYIRIPFVFDMHANARYIRVKAVNPMSLPSWHKVKGNSWLFTDEVVVE